MDLKINNLKKIYNDIPALDIPHLEINKGELVGIVGNNGAGKTTLLRLILDLIQATEGEVLIDGVPVQENKSWKEKTGSFLDEGFLIEFLYPLEYFHFAGKTYNIAKEVIDERLEKHQRFLSTDITDNQKLIRELSTGNKQKTGIIGSLLMNAPLIILDEPFNFLDPTSQIRIKNLLKQYNEDHAGTMLVSSHNIQYLADICDRIILLEKGKIIKDVRAHENDLAGVAEYFAEQM